MTNNNQAVIVSDEMANRMSLFFAHGINCLILATPMTKMIIDSVNNQIQNKGMNINNAADIFGILAAFSFHGTAMKRFLVSVTFSTQHDPHFFLRVMTTSILFYDHISPVGAFASDSKISIRASVKQIQTFGVPNVETYLNVLRFSSLHFNDESTPKAIKASLAS